MVADNFSPSPEQDTIEIKTALFVDYDNIFITLQGMSKDASYQFAQHPEDWVSWLERELPFHRGYITSRDIRIKRCYLNPHTIWNSKNDFRPPFNNLLFQVVECPPLTKTKKTATDMEMAISALEVLYREPQIDEFIILSADADFTPLLRRIHEAGKESKVLSFGHASDVYLASAGYVIDPAQFYYQALLWKSVTQHILDYALRRLGQAGGQIDISALEEDIASEFSYELYNSRWMGYDTFLTLLQRNTHLMRTATLVMDGDSYLLYDPDPAQYLPEEPTHQTGIKAEISEYVRELVSSRPEPLTHSAVADKIRLKFQAEVHGKKWMGHSNFRTFLATLDLGALVNTNEGPGYIYDPGTSRPPIIKGKKPATPTKAQVKPMADYVRSVLRSSDVALEIGHLANLMRAQFPSVRSPNGKWMGHTKFYDFLRTLSISPIKIQKGAPNSPGYVYDPSRHVLPK